MRFLCLINEIVARVIINNNNKGGKQTSSVAAIIVIDTKQIGAINHVPADRKRCFICIAKIDPFKISIRHHHHKTKFDHLL